MKKWYHSKMLYANVIGIAVILLSAFGLENISTEVVAGEAAILGVINLILRSITNQGLEK